MLKLPLASGTPLPSAWGLCLRYPHTSEKSHLTRHGVTVRPFTSRNPTHQGATPTHPREQPLYTSGSTPQFRKHLPSAQNSPHVSEQATVYTQGIPHLREHTPFTSEHPTLQGTPPIHLRTPSSTSAPSERRPEAPPYLLRRQLYMQGAGGGARR